MKLIDSTSMGDSSVLSKQMALITKSATDEDMTQPSAGAVQEQLKRLVAHPLFSLSRRYPALLSYIVEQKLLGNEGGLKERTIGMEVFGREPDYDVNIDPVVRTSAAEVRKRLIQYYYGPGHTEEVVIELYAGSYVPVFREPLPKREEAASFGVTASDETPVEPSEPAEPAHPLEGHPSVKTGIRSRSHRWWWFAGVVGFCSCAALLAGVAIGRYNAGRVSSDYDKFWSPITSSTGVVTYALGSVATTPELQKSSPEDESSASGILHVSDVIALARTIVPLVPRHKPYRVLSARSTTFPQLREGPVVLIGALDNVWAMRIAQDFPFGFEVRDEVPMIVDRKNPSRTWTVQWEVPQKKPIVDYAVVARVHDKLTGQPVILIGGILGEGTDAASEVVSNPVYLEMLLKGLPANWMGLNFEAVIQTRVIGGHPGPPEILASRTW